MRRGYMQLSWCLAWLVLASRAAMSADYASADKLPPASQRFAAERADVAAEVPDFQRHVDPLLGRLGCNGRACHGSFQGRGGFRLSLFGYDFAMDHAAVTGESQSESGHRVDHQSPQQSLLLRKPTAAVDHEGGERFAIDSWEYRLLQQWIAGGAIGTPQPMKLVDLQVEPSEITFQQVNQPTQLSVTAIWQDGSREDVTCLCRFRSNDDSVVEVSSEGRVQARGSGDTHVIAFYDNGVVTVPVMLAGAASPDVAWPADVRTTAIDERINRRLRTLGLVPSPVCSDSEFLRRLSIDLTGTLPTPKEVQQFLADRSPTKRDQLIEEMLQRPAFAAWWATKLCDFTGCNPNQQAELGQELAEQWYMWIYQRLRENTPYDEIAARILLANGREAGVSYPAYAAEISSYFRDDQPADFAQRSTMPHYWSRRTLASADDKALAVAHSFLGLRLQCAQCHKHPWDQWTQEDFRQFSAFFENVKFGVAPDAREEYSQLAQRVGLSVRGDEGVSVPANVLARAQQGESVPWREVYVGSRKQAAELQLLQSGTIALSADQDPRIPIVAWMRQPDNPWFARALVNRVWASCFHVGLVDPPDDLNAANPPSHPEVLDWLAQEFVAQGYDLRWLLREIVQSSTWQRSSLPNASNAQDRRNFSRMIPRRLPAEVVYDSIKQVVAASDQQEEVRNDLSRRATGHLSMRMAGTYAMHVFGKPERAVTCDCERVNEPTLLQAVFLQNDPLIQIQLAESGWLAEIATRAGETDAAERQQWIELAWLRTLGRPPTASELQRSLQHLSQTSSDVEGMTDLLWSLLNTKEFLLNH